MKSMNKPEQHLSSVSPQNKKATMKSRQIDFEGFVFYAIMVFIAMFAFSVCAHGQTTTTPPFEIAAFKDWVELLTAGAVYLLTFLSYKIPFLNRIPSTSVRYIVIAGVALVFILAFGLSDFLSGLSAVGLPSFVAVLLKALFGLKTPKAQPTDVRTNEQKSIDLQRKKDKMNGK